MINCYMRKIFSKIRKIFSEKYSEEKEMVVEVGLCIILLLVLLILTLHRYYI